jgi:hypothetical protein
MKRILMKREISAVVFSLVLSLFCFTGNSSEAQQIQITPITPDVTAPSGSPLTKGYDPAAIPSQLKEGMQLRLSQPSPGTESAQQLSEQAATPAPEETSEFEQFIAGTSSSEVSTQIKQFGYDLFRVPPSAFAPSANVPVGPGYVVGPGDEIRIAVWEFPPEGIL